MAYCCRALLGDLIYVIFCIDRSFIFVYHCMSKIHNMSFFTWANHFGPQIDSYLNIGGLAMQQCREHIPWCVSLKTFQNDSWWYLHECCTFSPSSPKSVAFMCIAGLSVWTVHPRINQGQLDLFAANLSGEANQVTAWFKRGRWLLSSCFNPYNCLCKVAYWGLLK